jgi:hypothetical protein
MNSAVDEALSFVEISGRVGAEEAKSVMSFINELNDHIELSSAVEGALEHVNFMSALDEGL